MGSWWANDFKAKSQEDYDDLWIVPFPEINPEFARDSIDAPVDGMSVRANAANPEGGAAFAEWCGSENGMLAAQAAGILLSMQTHVLIHQSTTHSTSRSLLLSVKRRTL